MPPFHDELAHFSAVLQNFCNRKHNFNDKLKFLGSRIYLFTLFIRICNQAELKYEFVTLRRMPHSSKQRGVPMHTSLLTWQ